MTMRRLRDCDVTVRIVGREDDCQPELRHCRIELFAHNGWDEEQPALLLTEQQAATLGGLLIAAAGASPSIRPGYDHGYAPISALQEYDSVPGRDEGIHESVALVDTSATERIINLALHTGGSAISKTQDV